MHRKLDYVDEQSLEPIQKKLFYSVKKTEQVFSAV